MKIGCSSWSYHKVMGEGKLDQMGWLRKCAEELEIDGVELLDAHFPSTAEEYLKKIKKEAIDLGLTISCVSVSNHFTCSEEEKRLQEVEKVKKWVDIASYLGAPILRIFAGAAEELGKPGVWEEVIKCLKECASYGESKGIVIGLENHGGFGTDEVLRMLKETGSPWLKLTLDTGNFPADPYVSIEKTAEEAVIVHTKFYEFDERGKEKRLDYERIIPILKDARFRGYLSIEYEGPGDELIDVPKAVNELKRLS